MAQESRQVVNYDEYFSWHARNLKNSILAEMFQKFALQEDAIILHAGLPPAESFPLLSITATTPCISSQPHNTLTAADTQACSTQQGAEAAQPVMQINLTPQLVQDAQQYMFHAGHPPLLRWVRDMAATQHQPPNPVDCAMSSGAVDAITAAVSCLLDAGDYILCEEFTYPHAPQCTFVPRQLNMLPISMDEYGMRPDSLRHVLSTTPPSPITGRPPRVLYVIPAGQNPTGSVMHVERKREIYQICREHGIIIIEDDAYYWLQYPKGASVPEINQPGLQLPASFLSMDVDSRVLRIDTFAKLLGPGFRLGWVTGAPKLVSKVGHAIQAGTCGPCSLSQVLVGQLLGSWGREGFETYVKKQQALYARRADAVSAAAAHHLQGLATWNEPRAGMFMWFKLAEGLDDVDSRLLQQLVGQHVAVVPGRPFWTDLKAQEAGAPCPYFRVAFSCVPEDRIDEAFRRLAEAIRGARAEQAGAAAVVAASAAAGAPASDGAGAEVEDAIDHEEDGMASGGVLPQDEARAEADAEGVVCLKSSADSSSLADCGYSTVSCFSASSKSMSSHSLVVASSEEASAGVASVLVGKGVIAPHPHSMGEESRASSSPSLEMQGAVVV